MQIKGSKLKIILGVLIVEALALATMSMDNLSPKKQIEEDILTEAVLKRSFPIDVRTVGELEAAHSTSIACCIRTDQPKVIELVSDGTHVNTSDLLVKVDATPFEKKVEELQGSIADIENQILSLEHALAWETEQAIHEAKATEFELETSQLELNKIINGDGPLEKARLHAAMQKAQIKYEELNSFSDDLIALEEQGYLSPTEVKQTQKKLQEERENFDNAELQYESYVLHVYPMQVKKAETAVRRLLNKQEEAKKNSDYKITKAEVGLSQAQQQLADAKRQLRDAQYELALTEIRAPSAGMVVLREEYRSGQKRKPRVGDTLVRNQAVLDLPDLSTMMVKTKVREIDLYKVEINKLATVEVDAYPNLQLEGKVTFIGILAISDAIRPGDEKNFEVRVKLDQTDPRLRPGMTARVTIHAGKVEDSLTVPIHSVFESNKQNFCYVSKKGVYTKQPIEIGMSNDQWVAVLSGLNENDRVSLVMPPEAAVVQASKESFYDRNRP
jgi:HlyD family secretion protein